MAGRRIDVGIGNFSVIPYRGYTCSSSLRIEKKTQPEGKGYHALEARSLFMRPASYKISQSLPSSTAPDMSA
jgi:hypothetical protein